MQILPDPINIIRIAILKLSIGRIRRNFFPLFCFVKLIMFNTRKIIIIIMRKQKIIKKIIFALFLL